MKKFITITDRELVEDWTKERINTITGFKHRSRPKFKITNNLEEFSNE